MKRWEVNLSLATEWRKAWSLRLSIPAQGFGIPCKIVDCHPSFVGGVSQAPIRACEMQLLRSDHRASFETEVGGLGLGFAKLTKLQNSESFYR